MEEEQELQEIQTPATPTPQEESFLHSSSKDEVSIGGSLGGGGSYAASITEDMTFDPYSTDDLLRVEADGFCGLVERVPMTAKLVVMCVTSLLGMTALAIILIVFTSRDIKEAKFANEFQRFVSQIRPVILAIQDEREAANNYLKRVTQADYYRPILEQRVNTSRQLFEQVRPLYSSFQKKYGDLVEEQLKIVNCVTGVNYDNEFCQTQAYRYLQLPVETIREKTMDGSILAYLVVPFYNQSIYALLELLSRVITAGGSNPNANSYVLTLRIIEMEQELRLLGANALYENALGPPVLGAQRYRELYKYYRLTQEWTFLFRVSSPLALVRYFDGIMPASFASQYLKMQEFIANRDIDMLSSLKFEDYSLDEWYGNSTQKIDILLNLMHKVEDTMISDAQRTVNRSVGVIIAIMCIVVIFWILSTLTVVFLSFTIIGPWRRLNMIQELTISKFVPRGFLRLLGAKKITDIQLGKHVQKKLTMVTVDIKNFSKLTKSLQSDQVFAFINSYLNHVSPIIRKYDGFIDKYLGENICAIFGDPKKGMKACVEIQACIESFNRTSAEAKLPQITVGIGAHSDEVTIGAVGEQERLSGTVLGSSAVIANRLERLTSKLKARICTTITGLALLKNVPKRLLGHITVLNSNGDLQDMEVYELLKDSGHDADTLKITFKALFEKGVRYFYKGMYEHSLKAFTEYLSNKEDDACAIAYLKRSTKLASKTRQQVAQLTSRQTLSEPVLKKGFQDFCISERSTENSSLYNEILAYKELQTTSDRTWLARKMYDTYLQQDAIQAVNINDILRQQVHNKIVTNQVDATLFDSTQLELEILMGDTLKRYKTTNRFAECFGSSSLSPKPTRLEQL